MGQTRKSLRHTGPGVLRPGATRPTPRLPASPAQRSEVAGEACLVCGRRPVDPAHLVPRRLGGCDSAGCVMALCRTHHRLFDTGRLALAPYMGAEQAAVLRHALTHVPFTALARALAAGGWPAPWQTEATTTITTGDAR